MNFLRNLVLPAAAALALLGPVSVMAQQQSAAPAAASEQSDPGRGEHRGFMHMFESLNLSAAQRAQIQQIMQQYHQSHPWGSRPDAQAREALHQQILGVLSPQQRVQFQQRLEQMRSNRHADHSGDDNAAPSTPQP